MQNFSQKMSNVMIRYKKTNYFFSLTDTDQIIAKLDYLFQSCSPFMKE